MDRDTGMTVNPITSASAFRLSILATQGYAQILGCFLLYCVFSIILYRMCTDVYRLLCMAY